MGKEEFVSILSRKGYISKIENGVVIVYAHNISNDKEMKAFLTEVKKSGQGNWIWRKLRCKMQKYRSTYHGSSSGRKNTRRSGRR